MKPFEEQLNHLIDLTENGRLTILCAKADISMKDLRFLSAMELISLSRAANNELKLTVTDEGVTWFYRKAQARKAFWLEHLTHFWVGVATGLLVAYIPLLISWLSARLTSP